MGMVTKNRFARKAGGRRTARDDYVAVVLGERYLQGKRGEDGDGGR